MTVRDSRTQARARTPGAEDDPTSTTVRDRVLGPTQCGISDVATKRTKGGRKPNICRCMLGAVLSWRCLGRHRLRCQPCSRIGENPPYGMIGGIEETSASSKPDPRLDPTRLDEVALIRDTISHYAPVLIAPLSIRIRRAGVQGGPELFCSASPYHSGGAPTEHDPGTRAEAFQSDVQRTDSATAISVRSDGPESPSSGLDS